MRRLFNWVKDVCFLCFWCTVLICNIRIKIIGDIIIAKTRLENDYPLFVHNYRININIFDNIYLTKKDCNKLYNEYIEQAKIERLILKLAGVK